MAGNVFSNCSSLTTGCFLYTDTGLTTFVSDGRYSDGTNCFRVASGEILAITPCSNPCECHDGTINNNGAFSYTDCSGNIQSGSGEQGSTVCFDINKSFGNNITDNGLSTGCSCV